MPCANEPSLRKWALGGVDEQQHAVHHRQPALDLTTEVGVAGGVDHVDHRHGAVRVVPVHRGVLGEDGDALFLLQVTGVHQTLNGVITAMRQCTRLPEHGIDEGRLTVVDVSDDGDVSKVGLRVHQGIVAV